MAEAKHYRAWARSCVPPLIILSLDAVLDIPRTVAVCPKCDASLVAHFEEWTEETDALWVCETAKLDCTTGPDIGSEEWEEWFTWHYAMPYVDWLPLEIKVGQWVNQRYRFNVD